MSFQNQNIGMMDQGYFVSRGDIINWLNDLLQLNLTKIQQLGSGAVYCQVIDVIHSNAVAMNKVNWKAKNDYQFIQNLRILQDAFKKIGIKRYVQVQKLAKAKYQDNLQFAQWLKRYYDLNCGDRGNNYLAEERRGGNNPDFGFAQKNVIPKTYNGTGQIIPKKEPSPPKKKQTVQPVVAVKKIAPQTAQIVSHQRPPTKQVEHRPKKIQKQKPKEQKVNTVKQESGDKVLLNKLKEAEDKLLMITEIIKSAQDSHLKVHMIAQILQISLQTEQQSPSSKQEQKQYTQNQTQHQTQHQAQEVVQDEVL